LNYGGVVNQIVGGWRASGIYSYQTGFPFTVISGPDYSESQSAGLYADRVCNGNNGPKTVQEYFQINCFSITGLAAADAANMPRYGNQQKDDMTGPPFSDLDFALLKDFAISERFKLQFRAETYNTINHPSFGYPNAYLPEGFPTVVGTVGQLTYTSNINRQIQFALKLLF